MSQEFSPAPEVAEVARDLIHGHHSHLGPVRIEYVFLSEPISERGKDVWGRARKVTGLNAYLALDAKPKEPKEPQGFFVIEIVKRVWMQLDEKSKRALIDHELTHLWVNDDGSLSIRPHDLEEFNDIVRRYGLWRADIELFLEASKQRPLFANSERAREAGA